MSRQHFRPWAVRRADGTYVSEPHMTEDRQTVKDLSLDEAREFVRNLDRAGFPGSSVVAYPEEYR